MEGVVATIHNGTSYFTAGDAINVDWPAGQLNFTFNASEPSSNTVYIRFTSDGSTSKTPHFWAQVGMRSYNVTDDEEETTTTDDDEDDPVYPVTIIPISKRIRQQLQGLLLGKGPASKADLLPEASEISCDGKGSPGPREGNRYSLHHKVEKVHH